MPQAYSRRIVIDGVAYQVNVVERPDGSFTASVSSPPDSGGDDGHARSTEPSYWRAIKAAEDLLSARAGHRLWLANEDDIEWIRGYAGQDDAEFVDPNAAVEFFDNQARRIDKILKLGSQYLVKISSEECWLGELQKDGVIRCFGNYGCFFDAIEAR
jgi:hypothetical protein